MVVEELRRRVKAGELDLPLPAAGHTRARFRALAALGAEDLSLARLAEGHCDAIAILAEAGRQPQRGATYGVWAAEPPDARVTAERSPRGFRLRGTKKYASGARGLDRALVTAGDRLFDVGLGAPGVRPVAGTWAAVGMAATDSLDVAFEDVELGERDEVGGPGFYVGRPGFWRGAVGVAACWYGGALGAFTMLRARPGERDAHQLAHLGAIAAACSTMAASLDAAADEMDRGIFAGRTRALVVRHVVESGCQEVLTRAGRASGSGPLTFDAAHARRAADLVVYLRQHHGERDLEALGRAVLEDAAWTP